MIKHFLTILLFGSFVFASGNYELKLYEKVLPIVLSEEKIVVYADESSQEILKDSHIFELSDNCSKATLLIGKDFSGLDDNCLNKPIFATSYRSFKEFNSSFGAFYWRKGRPQIRFSRHQMKAFKFYLPNSLLKYTIQ